MSTDVTDELIVGKKYTLKVAVLVTGVYKGESGMGRLIMESEFGRTRMIEPDKVTHIARHPEEGQGQ